MLRKRKFGNAYEICPSDAEVGPSLTESAIKMMAKPQKHEKKTAVRFLTDCCRRFFCIKPNVSDSDDEEIIYTSTPHVK
jgi:hypothetical protein